MREEAVQSDDDIAVAAAKQKLAALANRPGYEQAMHPTVNQSRWPRRASFLGALTFGVLAYATYVSVASVWLKLLLILVLAAMAFLSLLLGIGTGPEPTPEAYGAVVTGKQFDPETKLHRVTLLREDGRISDLVTLEAIFELLKAGDVGVAHIRPLTDPSLIAFHRL